MNPDEKSPVDPLEQLTQENRIRLQTAVDAIDMLLQDSARRANAYDYTSKKLVNDLEKLINEIRAIFSGQTLPPAFSELVDAVQSSIKDSTYYEERIDTALEKARANLYDVDYDPEEK